MILCFKIIYRLHIRRTDKINSESVLFTIEEYMVHVEEFFQIHQFLNPMETFRQTVYLATDDASVIDEIKKK